MIAEEALKLSPASSWASHAVLGFCCAKGDWAGAASILHNTQSAGPIEKAIHWRAGRRVQPPPDLADAYAHVKLGDSARQRLVRVETLGAKMPGHIEGALAIARAAIDAPE